MTLNIKLLIHLVIKSYALLTISTALLTTCLVELIIPKSINKSITKKSRNYAALFRPLWWTILFAAGIVNSFRINTDRFFKAGAVFWADWLWLCHNIPPFFSAYFSRRPAREKYGWFDTSHKFLCRYSISVYETIGILWTKPKRLPAPKAKIALFIW